MAIGIEGGMVVVMIVGVGVGNIARKTGRKTGITIGRDTKILSRRSLERT